MKNFMDAEHNIRHIYFSCRIDTNNAKRVHKNRAFHGLVLHTEGDRTYVFEDGKKVRASKNDLTYLPLGSNYTVEKVMGKGECYAINYSTYDETEFEPFSIRLKNPPLFLEHYKKAEKAWKSNKSTSQMECKAILYRIICDMVKEFESGYAPINQRSLLLPAIEYIEEHYTGETISISDIALLCGISETYFRRLFTKTYGTSPVKYIRSLKIRHAKALISTGLYSISEVAELSGWGDEAYYSCEFKKATGISPSDFEHT